jgi:hypothetical protein
VEQLFKILNKNLLIHHGLILKMIIGQHEAKNFRFRLKNIMW